MAASQCAKVRLWRWRRNPLRRRSDVIEAWVVLCGWLLALVGAVFGGLTAADAVVRSAEQQRAESHQVTAVLVKDAEDPGPTRVATDHLVWATVRWTDQDGAVRTDEARVPPKTKAGGKVEVWADRNGILPKAPLSEAEILMHSVAGGILAGAATASLALGSAWVVRLALERRRLEQWAAEWERLDTPWGWKMG
ncbi:Rv1733c family protein [Streptomyces sp. UG1]|uniref:Rv1733c family protein n=1 Tax=Streptomyces sp. UG1 TaxID=3417652 RepID=UPI003CF128BE